MDKPVSGPFPREQRRSRRFQPQRDLLVEVHEKHRCQKVRAMDVARHGLLLSTAVPLLERHLVKLTIHLPGSPISAVASVTRTLRTATKVDGIGVQFFALSGEAKKRWDDFILTLQSASRPERAASLWSDKSSPSPAAPWVPTPSTSWPRSPLGPPARVVASLASGPSPKSPLKAPALDEVDDAATFIVKMKTVERLAEFADSHLTHGGMVLYTPVLYKQGDLLKLVFVHPKTDEEFHLPGLVFATHSERPKRLDIHFVDLTSATIEAFRGFVRTGAPPSIQLRAPAAAGAKHSPADDDGIALDVDVFDDPVDIEEVIAEPAPASLPDMAPVSVDSWVVPPSEDVATDPGFRPRSYLLRCSDAGGRCTAEPYPLELGPCRGVLGVVADLDAFVGNPSGHIISVPRFIPGRERRARVQGFLDAGGRLDAPSDLMTLLGVASLVDPPTDPSSGKPLDAPAEVVELTVLARHLREGAIAATPAKCPTCQRGHLTVTRVPT